jgi:hypothetical protein
MRTTVPTRAPLTAPLAAGAQSGSATAPSVVEQLLDVMFDDPELLAAEFDAIVTAEWPTPPVERRGPTTAADVPDSHARRWIDLALPGMASRPRHPGLGGWARQRSPPHQCSSRTQVPCARR